MPGVKNYTFMPGEGHNGPPIRSQLVVVRFSKSRTLWFSTVLRNSHAKFYQNRPKIAAPTAPKRKSARATQRVQGTKNKKLKMVRIEKFFFSKLIEKYETNKYSKRKRESPCKNFLFAFLLTKIWLFLEILQKLYIFFNFPNIFWSRLFS